MNKRSFDYYMKRTRNQNWSIEYHTHDSYEIVYYISGTGIAAINKEEYNYSDSTFLLIPPNVPHREEAKTDTELCCLAFRPLENQKIHASFLLRSDESEAILQNLNEIESELKYRDNGYEEMIELLISQIIIRTSRTVKHNQNTETRSNDIIYNALSYICNYYYTDIDLPQLAQSIGYSYDRFRHLFKECYGYSPKQFILWQRIAQAQVLLRQSNYTMAEIAGKIGFNTTAQFNNTFFKFTKMTPTEYIKRYKR